MQVRDFVPLTSTVPFILVPRVLVGCWVCLTSILVFCLLISCTSFSSRYTSDDILNNQVLILDFVELFPHMHAMPHGMRANGGWIIRNFLFSAPCVRWINSISSSFVYKPLDAFTDSSNGEAAQRVTTSSNSRVLEPQYQCTEC